MTGIVTAIICAYGLGLLSGMLWSYGASPTREKAIYEQGFNAAMAVIRKRNSERGKKAAARRRSAQP
jgi:hypothetical protein